MSLKFNINKLNLTLLNNNFCIKDLNDKILYLSDNLKGMFDNMILIIDNVYNYNNLYYEKQKTEVTLDNETYYIETYTDITKHYNEIIKLNKIIRSLKSENINLKIDEVTKLPVRKELNSYLERTKYTKDTKICVMCDIDNFKKVNDTYGHVIGDLFLCRFGHHLLDNVRVEDFVGRYGGEEFLLIFNTDSIDVVVTRLNKVISSLMEDKLLEKYQLNNVTFSAGMYILKANSDTKLAIENVDKAVYYVKINGKNGIAIYDDEKNDFTMLGK